MIFEKSPNYLKIYFLCDGKQGVTLSGGGKMFHIKEGFSNGWDLIQIKCFSFQEFLIYTSYFHERIKTGAETLRSISEN